MKGRNASWKITLIQKATAHMKYFIVNQAVKSIFCSHFLKILFNKPRELNQFAYTDIFEFTWNKYTEAGK